MANAILVEAALSFLGLGAQPPTPSWGLMVSSGRDFLLVAPHIATVPGWPSWSRCWDSTCWATGCATLSTRA